MTLNFSSLTDQQLIAQYKNCQYILIRSQDECNPYTPKDIDAATRDAVLLREALKERAGSAAARALPSTGAGVPPARPVSVSPYLPLSPRIASGSIETREASTLGASARFDAGSGASSSSSPVKSSRDPILSTVHHSDLVEEASAPVVLVHAEHISCPPARNASCSSVALPPLPAVAAAPATPLNADPLHSAFARAVQGSGSCTPAHSILSKAVSSLTLDQSGSDYSSVISSLEPEAPRRRSLIAEHSRSPRGSPLGDVVTEEELEAERGRQRALEYLPKGVSLLEFGPDAAKDPLLTYYFRAGKK